MSRLTQEYTKRSFQGRSKQMRQDRRGPKSKTACLVVSVSIPFLLIEIHNEIKLKNFELWKS